MNQQTISYVTLKCHDMWKRTRDSTIYDRTPHFNGNYKNIQEVRIALENWIEFFRISSIINISIWDPMCYHLQFLNYCKLSFPCLLRKTAWTGDYNVNQLTTVSHIQLCQDEELQETDVTKFTMHTSSSNLNKYFIVSNYSKHKLIKSYLLLHNCFHYSQQKLSLHLWDMFTWLKWKTKQIEPNSRREAIPI